MRRRFIDVFQRLEGWVRSSRRPMIGTTAGIAVLTAAIAAWLGAVSGLVLVASVILLWRLAVPQRLRRASPDGSSVLEVLEWRLAWVWFTGAFAFGGRLLSLPSLSIDHPAAVFAANLLVGAVLLPFYFWLVMYMFNPLMAVQRIVVDRGARGRSSQFKLCDWDTTATDYLWLPTGDAVLIAQQLDLYWLIYRWDLDASGGRGYPFGLGGFSISLGRGPFLRVVEARKDWPWLEELWRTAGYQPRVSPPMEDITAPVPLEVATDYRKETRRFFERNAPRAKGFVEYYLRASSQRPSDIRRCLEEALKEIPPEAASFDQVRVHVKAKIASCENP